MMIPYDSTYTDYQTVSDSSYTEVQSDPEVRKTIQLLVVCGLAALVSGLLYIMTGNVIISAVPAGLTCLVCMLFYTPLAFVFLYSALPFEMLVRPSGIFSISKIVGILIFVSFILTQIRHRMNFPTIVKWLISFGLLCLLSIFWALSPIYSLISVVTVLLHIGLIVLLVNTIKSVKMFRLILWGLLIASGVSTGLLFMGVGASVETDPTGRISFEEMNPNILGSQLAVSIICGVYLFLASGFWGKLFSFSICILTGAGMLFSQSRSSLFGIPLAMGTAFILMMKGRNKFIYLVVFLIFCLIGYIGFKFLLSSEFLGERATERLRTSQYSLEESGRLHYWEEGLKYFSERPLQGYGFRNYPIRYGGGMEIGRDAHNSYISVMAELGLIGFFMYLVVLYLVYKKTLTISIQSLQWLCWTLLIFSILNAITHTTYNQKDFWYAIGFITLVTTITNRYSYDDDSPVEEVISDNYEDSSSRTFDR